mgnify:FL=1
MILSCVIGGIPGVVAKGFFRFSWRIREPYGCPTYFWVGAGFQSEAMSSMRPTPMSVADPGPVQPVAVAEQVQTTCPEPTRHPTGGDAMLAIMRVELLTSPGCPNAEPARSLLRECLKSLGIAVTIIDRVGTYPSPTVLIDDVDVMQPDSTPPSGDACRLDVPTSDRILRALKTAAAD